MIHHIAITSESVERLAAFYRTLPGLFVISENMEGDVLRSVWFGTNNSKSIIMIEKGERKAPQALIFDLISSLVFQTDPQEDEVMKLFDRIFPIIESRTENTFYFRDPDGNQLGYSAYPEKLQDFIKIQDWK